ncbi:MAG TPA: hypothetical protein VHX63_17095 [Acidobacteriaceae bacterium]|nr:hypothetical protein [Acidobacteriaceae bacterium]
MNTRQFLSALFLRLPHRIAGSLFLLLVLALPSLCAPIPVPVKLIPVPAFPIARSPYALIQPAQPQMTLTVVGPRGTFLGQQDGSFEAWVFPIKLLSNFRISAELQNYPVPIDVNSLASLVDVEPDHTTITYSHVAFTIREILFAPRHSPDGTGVVALFQIDSVRPMQLTFSFTPELKRLWPAPNDDVPDADWISTPDGSGYYILSSDFSDLAAALAIPGAHPGIMPPFQERVHTYPTQFVLNFDPKKDRDLYYPLLMVSGNTTATATQAALQAGLQKLDQTIAPLYRAEAENREHFFDHRLTIETPDPQLDLAYRWALLSMNENKIRLYSDGEVGLAAGFNPSGDSDRPGFGWFFGRDALWTSYALDSTGDFVTTRQALEFLLRRQRSDGKIMHEYSQTAPMVDWSHMPFEYAAADATPLLLMAAADYLATSGDTAFIRAHWPQWMKSWQFELRNDSATNSIYNNLNGTAWVESWPSGMPYQEIYLAALDEQASIAMNRLASAMQDTKVATQAQTRAAAIATQIMQEYSVPATGFYVFSHNANGSQDTTATIYPTVAWWDGTYALPQSNAMFRRWASAEFSTDWGTRDVGEQEPFYDPLSYHQGSVWPLFTGWASLAEYRTGHALAGYAHLMQNTDLTYAQDLGNVTELLSGAFYQTFGRSTAHQLWSSAMIVTPLLRGLFGLEWDTASNTLSITPHLPATWDHAALHHVSLGNQSFDLDLKRQQGSLLVEVIGDPGTLHLTSHVPGAKTLSNGRAIRIPLPAVEVYLPVSLPEPGSRTALPKVISENYSGHDYALTLEAQGGSTVTLQLRRNAAHLQLAVTGATLKKTPQGEVLVVSFPAQPGYQQTKVDLHW